MSYLLLILTVVQFVLMYINSKLRSKIHQLKNEIDYMYAVNNDLQSMASDAISSPEILKVIADNKALQDHNKKLIDKNKLLEKAHINTLFNKN